MLPPSLACSSAHASGQILRLDFTDDATRAHAPSLAFRSLESASAAKIRQRPGSLGWFTDSCSSTVPVPASRLEIEDSTLQNAASRSAWPIFQSEHGIASRASDTHLSTCKPSVSSTLLPTILPLSSAPVAVAASQPLSWPRLSSKSLSPLLAHCRDLVSLQKRNAGKAAGGSSVSSLSSPLLVREEPQELSVDRPAMQLRSSSFPDWMATFDPTVPDVMNLGSHGSMSQAPLDLTCVLSRRPEVAFPMLEKTDSQWLANSTALQQQPGVHQHNHEKQPDVLQQQQWQQHSGSQHHQQKEVPPSSVHVNKPPTLPSPTLTSPSSRNFVDGAWALKQHLELPAPNSTAHGSSNLSFNPSSNGPHLSPTYSSSAAHQQR